MGHRLRGVESDRTRSDLETLFLEVCAHYGFPPPEVNVKLGRWEVDFLWRSQRVVVETDYWTYHRGSVAFEDDHARDLDLLTEQQAHEAPVAAQQQPRRPGADQRADQLRAEVGG